MRILAIAVGLALVACGGGTGSVQAGLTLEPDSGPPAAGGAASGTGGAPGGELEAGAAGAPEGDSGIPEATGGATGTGGLIGSGGRVAGTGGLAGSGGALQGTGGATARPPKPVSTCSRNQPQLQLVEFDLCTCHVNGLLLGSIGSSCWAWSLTDPTSNYSEPPGALCRAAPAASNCGTADVAIEAYCCR